MQVQTRVKRIMIKCTRMYYLKTKLSNTIKNKVSFSRGSPFVEEAVLILIALFFFVILFTAFQDILKQVMDIVKNIFQNTFKL